MVEIKVKDPEQVIKGRKNKQSGAVWERKVRADLEERKWIVCKWSNNIEFGHTANHDGSFTHVKWKDLTLQNGKHYPGPNARMVAAKHQYNPFRKSYSLGAGFPDFIAFQESDQTHYAYEIIGVEAKSNGYLKPEEKEKCKWLLRNKIFSKILIAQKKKEGRKVVVEYVDFETKYGI